MAKRTKAELMRRSDSGAAGGYGSGADEGADQEKRETAEGIAGKGEGGERGLEAAGGGRRGKLDHLDDVKTRPQHYINTGGQVGKSTGWLASHRAHYNWLAADLTMPPLTLA